ncbi:MAG: excinuclease ABC subunit UvrC [Nevskiales bacterium]
MSPDRQPPEPPAGGFDVSRFLKQLTSRPGVYRMLDAGGSVLYVGKARNLKRRVSSYFSRKASDAKTHAMVAQVARVEVTVTQTEDEALLLESNLIKAHQPRYNVVFRDDKSYPYLFLSGNHPFPRLAFHRGAQRIGGRYFGPYPNVGAVREMQDALHKLFRIRQCEDSFFANRSRPCLQYQIKRCTAPCVGLVTAEDYRRDVDDAIRLLDGKAEVVMQDLVQRMEQAATALEFEQAARYREQIAAIRRLQEQPLQAGGTTDCDVIVGDIRDAVGCVVIVSIRNRMNFGHRSFFPRIPPNADSTELLTAFISQHYLQQPPPREILLAQALPEHGLLEQALSARSGRRVSLVSRPRGARQRLLQIAQATLEQALSGRLASRSSAGERLRALQAALQLEAPPHHIECFDISHTRGERAVASCVVFVNGQPEKTSYRSFNIDNIEPGDDYAALRQAIGRRFARLKKGEGRIPGLLLIDGGAGQLTQGQAALRELEIKSVRLVAVAKGPTRKAGCEQLVLPGRKTPLILPADSPALHLIQQVRDEAHRFAIGGHRRQRDKARTRSVLDDIDGLGPIRRQRLLKTFGGARQLSRVSIAELMRVDGISATLARKIYDYFHDEA